LMRNEAAAVWGAVGKFGRGERDRNKAV